jgi:hypothetical protein
MKQHFIMALAMMCMSLVANGQFAEDFSDGDFSNWSGSTADFIINANQQLQLNAPSGNTASNIHVPVSFTDSMVWEFYFKLDFAPSTSNQLKIYLGLSSPDISTADGYLLEIGASGDQDPLVFKYTSNGNEDVIATSSPGLVANQPVELTLRVKRTADGIWTFHDISESTPESLFSAQHTSTPLTLLNTFGFWIEYSDTRRDKFFFDNIIIQAPQPDTSSPEWQSLIVIDQQTLELQFDEPLADAPANDNNNYSVNNGIGNPDAITLNAARNTVTLHFATSFASLQPYTLSVQQLRDDAGNSIAPQSRNFTYIDIQPALPYDILITEIMADPTPVIALPDAEYIELFNASDRSFQLSAYTLRVGASERALNDFILQPDSFVIVTDVDAVPSFQMIGTVIGIDLPSLTNSGATISLLNAGDMAIHEVMYSDEWYGDPDKADGGWSLEMKQPGAICTESENWSASNNLAGGTPGHINSIWSLLQDDQGPELLSLFPSSPTSITLRFSERIDDVVMLNALLYNFDPALPVQDVILQDANAIVLMLSAPIADGTTYTLLPFTATDCLGNETLISEGTQFGLIVDAQPGDVLINEILFNPASGGSRYIEVINVSAHFIDLSTLAIGRLTQTQQDIYTTGIQEVLAPGGIAAFTPERIDILSRYTVPNPNHLYTATLPTWDDESDNASLLANGMVIDSFTFSADWHHPALADQNGVSLERVSIEAPTILAANWHSASSISDYGTPTGPNSQALGDTSAINQPYTVINRIFSPDEDGFKDYLAIQFESGNGDDLASAWIYDMEGRVIYQLANNELVGTSSLLQWDGRTTDGDLAEMGMYIVLVQLWRPDGDVKKYQSSCALVKR